MTKLWMLSLVVSLFISQAFAANFCEKLYTARPVLQSQFRGSKGSAELLRTFANLIKPTSTNAQILNREQQVTLARTGLSMLTPALSTINEKAALLDTPAREKLGLAKDHITYAIEQFKLLQNQESALQRLDHVQSMIDQVLGLTTQVAILSDQAPREITQTLDRTGYSFIDHFSRDRLAIDFTPNAKGHEHFTVKADQAYIPTEKSMSVYDFNYLAGTGIYPIGVIYGAVRADGAIMNAHDFYTHDQRHSRNQMLPFLNGNKKAFWNALLSWADSATGVTRAIRHQILFKFSHEQSVIKKAFENRFRFHPTSAMSEGQINFYVRGIWMGLSESNPNLQNSRRAGEIQTQIQLELLQFLRTWEDTKLKLSMG